MSNSILEQLLFTVER